MKKVLSRIKEKIKDILNFTKKHKKKVLIGLAVFIILFLPTFLYINLTNPTLINKYIASVANKGVPANNAFEDQVFYNAVVDAYNKKNNANLPYTTNLTDEQLKTITEIDYSGSGKEDKISSANGIEKLTSLTALTLGYNSLSNIDLSQNTKLTSLNLEGNDLYSIDLSKNASLIYLDLKDNNLNSIDLSQNTRLTSLFLSYNNLSNIDLSQNTKLGTLYLGNNNLSSIDLSDNIKLTSLHLEGNDLDSIDLSKNTLLLWLDLSLNNLINIDLSQNTELTTLYLYNNNLSNIDLSQNTELTHLSLHNNNLSNIDLSQNTELTTLYLYNNNLSNIDLSQNTELTDLNLGYNNLNSIDLSNNNSLTRFKCKDNNLLKIIKLYDNFDISTVKDDISTQINNQTYIDFGKDRIINPIEDYKFYINNKLVIKESVDVNTLIKNLGLKNITAKVYDKDNQLVENNVSNNDILKLYYNDEEIQSIPIHIFNNEYFEDENFYNVVVDAYNKENNANLPYTTNLTDEQLKTITEIDYSGFNKEVSEKINSTKEIEKLTSLTTLDLRYNNISNIDLSQNTKLTSLNLEGNDLDSIDLSKNTLLLWLDLSLNNLINIDLSRNTELTSLSLAYNNLSNIDLSQNTELGTLYLDNNNLSSIDLSNNTKLTDLELYSNNLISIDLSNNTLLTYLHLSSNNLNTIDLSQNTELTTLFLYNNNLSNIDLSKNIALKYLHLYNNLFDLGTYRMMLGTTVNSDNNIKLPEGSNKFYITYKIEDEDIASYNDGVIKGLKAGTTKLKATLNGVKLSSSSSSSDMVVEGVIKVFDIKSSKYKIDKENKYIYTKTDTDNNIIMKNITVENGTGKIENNEFKVMDEDVAVETYKIVSISSSKYDLSKDNIRLKKDEAFDIHSVNITNGQLEYKDNKLYVKYGDDVLKVYTITQTTRTKGDVNNDDKITVVDVSLLYRHVKKKSVITDSETLSISDINGDNKITVTDVSMIYRYVKGKIDEL